MIQIVVEVQSLGSHKGKQSAVHLNLVSYLQSKNINGELDEGFLHDGKDKINSTEAKQEEECKMRCRDSVIVDSQDCMNAFIYTYSLRCTEPLADT